jgi:hypothetical protein
MTDHRIGALIDDWKRLRSDLAAIERTEHPDIVDHHGRVWTWGKGTLYRHCGLAWPQRFVKDGRHGLPSDQVLSNPNYPKLCDVCLNGRTQRAA